MKFSYQLVERIPKPMREGVVYHTKEFELAGMLCACGCGRPITLLVPDGHRVWDEDGYATINPSVGVLDAPCKSHYFIRAGEVEWLPAFSDAAAAQIMHAQIARHVAHDAQNMSWLQKAKVAVRVLLAKLRALLGH